MNLLEPSVSEDLLCHRGAVVGSIHVRTAKEPRECAAACESHRGAAQHCYVDRAPSYRSRPFVKVSLLLESDRLPRKLITLRRVRLRVPLRHHDANFYTACPSIDTDGQPTRPGPSRCACAAALNIIPIRP